MNNRRKMTKKEKANKLRKDSYKRKNATRMEDDSQGKSWEGADRNGKGRNRAHKRERTKTQRRKRGAETEAI